MLIYHLSYFLQEKYTNMRKYTTSLTKLFGSSY